MSFTATSLDEICSADTMATSEGTAMLSFKDELGISVLSIHNLPPEVAEATAKAFNESMQKHRAEAEE